jgi:hypothetical protein
LALLGGPYEFLIDDLPTRPIQRARLVLMLWKIPSPYVILLDADQDEFVRLPWPPTPPADQWAVVALSPVGDHLVVRHRTQGLYWYELATERQRLLDPDPPTNEHHLMASVSHDNTRIATLSISDDPDNPRDDISYVIVNEITISGGTRQRRWRSLGGLPPGAVAWSPNAQLIAATYGTPERDTATVVIDTTGSIVQHYQDVEITPYSNGAWLNEQELLCRPTNNDLYGTPNQIIFNTHNGTHRPTGARLTPGARVNELLIHRKPSDENTRTYLETIRLDGTNAQPLITINEPCHLQLLDYAPATTPHPETNPTP